ncbi:MULTISPECIES: hypothetical protein [Nocardia]|uniref:hypothetical protein n=1 Tax=Nocardia abscessus TaxID=120957 RepID=UPI002457FF27|nr:hypothetical protein [Nocardia abscessus]
MTPITWPARTTAAAVPATIPALPLPDLAALSPIRGEREHYAVSAMTHHGRLCLKRITDELGWSDLRTLSVGIDAGAVVLTPGSAPRSAALRDGWIFLSADIRRGCLLRPGDQVLMVGSVSRSSVRLYPPHVLTAMLAAHHRHTEEESR